MISFVVEFPRVMIGHILCGFFLLYQAKIYKQREEYENVIEELGPKIESDVQGKMQIVAEINEEFVATLRQTVKERQKVLSETKTVSAVMLANLFEAFDWNIASVGTGKTGMRLSVQSALKNSVNIERFASVEVITIIKVDTIYLIFCHLSTQIHKNCSAF
jgi:hypothetical protein